MRAPCLRLATLFHCSTAAAAAAPVVVVVVVVVVVALGLASRRFFLKRRLSHRMFRVLPQDNGVYWRQKLPKYQKYIDTKVGIEKNKPSEEKWVAEDLASGVARGEGGRFPPPSPLPLPTPPCRVRGSEERKKRSKEE